MRLLTSLYGIAVWPIHLLVVQNRKVYAACENSVEWALFPLPASYALLFSYPMV